MATNTNRILTKPNRPERSIPAVIVPVPSKNRLPTGLTKLGTDWTGVFVRGPDAMFKGIRLADIAEKYLDGRKRDTLSPNDRQNLDTLETLRDLFLSVDESKPAASKAVKLKEFDDCEA